MLLPRENFTENCEIDANLYTYLMGIIEHVWCCALSLSNVYTKTKLKQSTWNCVYLYACYWTDSLKELCNQITPTKSLLITVAHLQAWSSFKQTFQFYLHILSLGEINEITKRSHLVLMGWTLLIYQHQ